MIYRVGDGNNPAYDYSSQLKSVGNAEGQEKFSLEHQKEQASSPKKEEKGEDKKLHEKPGAEIKRSGGVKLELSGAGKAEEESEMTNSRVASANSGSSLWQTVLSIWQALKTEQFCKITARVPNICIPLTRHIRSRHSANGCLSRV